MDLQDQAIDIEAPIHPELLRTGEVYPGRGSIDDDKLPILLVLCQIPPQREHFITQVQRSLLQRYEEPGLPLQHACMEKLGAENSFASACTAANENIRASGVTSVKNFIQSCDTCADSFHIGW